MKKLILYSLTIFITLCSCEKWIDVQPNDQVSEEMAFNTLRGFQKALNGVYLELTDRDIYGRNLSIGVIDVMAQLYTVTGNNYDHFIQYNYTHEKSLSEFDKIWSKLYYLIVNCNVILENCSEGNSALPGIWYNIVKGETLALRAMIHFDLLRLFGPIYDLEGEDVVCIPYVTNSNQEISPLLSAKDIVELIMKDLNEALLLLEDTDPIFTNGISISAGEDGTLALSYRQYRLNYFAVKALMARTHLWIGDKVNALKIAKEIIAENEKKKIFPFVEEADALNTLYPDRFFSTEVIFALYDSERQSEIFDKSFAPTLSDMDILTFNEDRKNQYYGDDNDYRSRAWAVTNGVLNFRKFYQSDDKAPARYRAMVPLIRLSEIYLMAAECTGDLQEAIRYLNTVRNSRNAYSITADSEATLMLLLKEEFRKEMLGEGQIFFFYKRLAEENIPNGRSATANYFMFPQYYVVPLPESEIKERLNN